MQGTVTLRADDGHYVCAEQGGKLIANRTTANQWETFQVIDLGGGQVALVSWEGKYVCAPNGGQLVADRANVGPWETFSAIDQGNGNFALRASTGQLVSAQNGGGRELIADRSAIGPWEIFATIQSIHLTPILYGPARELAITDNYVAFDVPVGAQLVMDLWFPSPSGPPPKEAAIYVYEGSAASGAANCEQFVECGNYARSQNQWVFTNDRGVVLPMIVTGWFKDGPPNPARPWLQAIQTRGGTMALPPGGCRGVEVGASFKDAQSNVFGRAAVTITF